MQTATPQLYGPCMDAPLVSRMLNLDGIQLYVPSALEDKQLRYLVDQGIGIVPAYGQIFPGQTARLLPPEGMRECCRQVLREKILNAESKFVLGSWSMTCEGYHRCLESYALAIREDHKRGRMFIAPGLYSPSPDEERCIRGRFSLHRDLARAYMECDAQDILPDFPFALELISKGLINDQGKDIKQPLYKIILTAYQISYMPTDQTHHPPPHEPPPEKKDYIWLVALGVGLIVVSRVLR